MLAQQTGLRETLEERCKETETHLGRLERELNEKVCVGMCVCVWVYVCVCVCVCEWVCVCGWV